MKTHDVQWSMPAPLWGRAAARGRFSEPALLRFVTDDFMDELADELEAGPEAIEALRVVPERYGTMLPEDDDPEVPVTLYQPVQQRYYMVATSLTCREQGLPDRTVDVVGEETASFVLRRLVPRGTKSVDPNDPTTYVECGWFKDRWKPVLRSTRLKTPLLDRPNETEERLPLFRQTYTPDSALKTLRRPRGIWVGLVPVARRQEFETAEVEGGSAVDPLSRPENQDENGTDDLTLTDPRLTFFSSRVIMALKETTQPRVLNSGVGLSDLRAPIVYALLDFYLFLKKHTSDVLLRWVENPNRSRSGLNDLQLRLNQGFGLMMNASGAGNASLALTWADALRVVSTHKDALEDGTATLSDILEGKNPDLNTPNTFNGQWERAVANVNVETLTGEVKEQLTPRAPSVADLPEDLTPTVRSAVGEAGVYVVRCVYERPRCEPYHPPTVSAPSRPFRMASYYDKEAPARPVRVELPGSTSIQDFRDAPKGVALIFSKELRNQVERVQNLTFKNLDEGEIDDGGGFGIGMICMLSLPIITIVGLILLLLMVNLLNIVFWWLPFFKICFPVPKRTD